MSRSRELLLWYHTAKHVSWSQCCCRLRRIVIQRIRRLAGSRAPLPDVQVAFDPGALAVSGKTLNDDADWSAVAQASVRCVDALNENRLVLLDRPVEFADEPNWHATQLSQLERYHLHYFEFVPDLVIAARIRRVGTSLETFRRLVDSWICANERLCGDGWHPYTISLRINNWLLAAAAFEDSLRTNEPFFVRFRSSLYGQCRFLAANLEHDVRGNHLLKNLRALIAAGLCFAGQESAAWLSTALNILRVEVDEQVHPDGGHFERSPGYHCAVLQDLLEIAVWLERFDGRRIEWLDANIRRMGDFLYRMVSADGRIPLLKDTAWNAVPQPSDVLACVALHLNQPGFKISDRFGRLTMLLFDADACRRFQDFRTHGPEKATELLRDSGYAIITRPASQSRLVMDVGRPCPDYLPAHAHADLLSFELELAGQPIVVDSGVYEYQAGRWRDYFRSTRAHNTVEVNGLNQSEVWGSFRVGRRGRVKRRYWKHWDGHALIQAEHDGYRQIGVPVDHRRTAVWHEDRFLLIIDELFGQGTFAAASYLHFHPDSRLQRCDDSRCTIGTAPADQVHVAAFGHDSIDVIRGQQKPELQGWYSERFGELQPNPVLALRLRGPGTQRMGYVISSGVIASACIASQTPDTASVVVTLGDEEFVLQLKRELEPVYGRTDTEDSVLQPLLHTGNRGPLRACA